MWVTLVLLLVSRTPLCYCGVVVGVWDPYVGYSGGVAGVWDSNVGYCGVVVGV